MLSSRKYLLMTLIIGLCFTSITSISAATALGTPGSIVNPSTGNSLPVAKFTFGKKVYRKGEPITYINFSYDPDTDGLPKQEWTGNENVFFEAGIYPISLKVTDVNGNESKTYTRNLVISNELFLDEAGYNVHYKAPGAFLNLKTEEAIAKFAGLPSTEVIREQPAEMRPLLVSDSPETLFEPGILYQDIVNGKARLYANHQNGMITTATFMIVATNMTTDPVIITTTNKGEVFPSIYANLFGHQASLDFLLQDTIEEKIMIAPGATGTYVQLPDLMSGQGMNAIYDVVTTGQVMFRFMAVDSFIDPPSPDEYGILPRKKHIRGTFPISEISWKISSGALSIPTRLTIGNGTSDRFITGVDALTSEVTMNRGNYGVMYHIHADHPPKLAILMLARGGVFKGPFMVNGELVLAPASGVITPSDGIFILARTTGKEKELVIEFTPPAASNFPIDLILWPLEDVD